MPTYEFRCIMCLDESEVLLKMKDYDSAQLVCKICGGTLERHFRSPINLAIPTHMQAAPNMGKKEKPRVPINVIDQNVDGSVRVSTIGGEPE